MFKEKVRRLLPWLRRPAAWVGAAFLAGLAGVITTAGTDVGTSTMQSARDMVCRWRSAPAGATDQPLFTVVVDRIENDADGQAQKRIVERLLPTDFVVLKGCNEGPDFLDAQRRGFDRVVREAATRELTGQNADVLIWGRLEGDRVRLRLADRNGYCSNEAVSIGPKDEDNKAAQRELVKALADHVIKALVSDCQGKKLDGLTIGQLRLFDRKIDYLAEHFADRTRADTKANLWLYRAWAKARLSLLAGGQPALQNDIAGILSGTPNNYTAAATLWGLKTFGAQRDIGWLKKRAIDEAYLAYRTWPRDTPAWAAVASLAADRIEAEDLRTPALRAAFYEHLMDLAGGRDDAFVPIGNGEVFRIWYRYAMAVTGWPQAPDADVEHGVRTMGKLVSYKLSGEDVPVTINALRLGYARSLYLSARRNRVSGRLLQAQALLDTIAAHPDGTKGLTPAMLAELRGKIDGALLLQNRASAHPK